jgi:hypothetical protein
MTVCGRFDRLSRLLVGSVILICLAVPYATQRQLRISVRSLIEQMEPLHATAPLAFFDQPHFAACLLVQHEQPSAGTEQG